MKFDHQKSFGYPVLRNIIPGDVPTEADYLHSEFYPTFDIKINLELNNIIIIYNCTVYDEDFLNALRENNAGVYIRIIGKATWFSRFEEVGIDSEGNFDEKLLKGELELQGEDIFGELEITPFISAKNDFLMKSERYTQILDIKNSILRKIIF